MKFFLNQLFSSLVSFKGIQAFPTGRFLIKVEQNQDFVCYVAPDCKAFMARIGAASLCQSAWVKQHTRLYRCFAARCRRILQGRFFHAQTLNNCLQKTYIRHKDRLGNLLFVG